MARPIIRPGTTPAPGLDVRHRSGPVVAARNPEQLARRLREPRSRAYVDALMRLDAGTVNDMGALADVLSAIHAEFGDLAFVEFPLGWVARCYLGAPYEVHTLDPAGNIVEHYVVGRPLPGELERARTLALHPAYAFIEVHRDALHCVREDGSVTRV